MKHTLRKESLKKRSEQPVLIKKAKEEKICKQIEESPFFFKAQTILFYYPIREEVNLLPLFEKYKKEKKCCFPRISADDKKNLTIHHIQSLDELAKGPYNIPQPSSSAPSIAPIDCDLIFVPGILFALDGHRLGYGQGFYDRLLKTTQSLHVGIAFQFQVMEKLPVEAHDVPLNIVITEEGTIDCNKKI